MYLLALFCLGHFYVSGLQTASPTQLWPLDNVSYFHKIKGGFTLPDSHPYRKCTFFADGHPVTKTKSIKLTGSDISFVDVNIKEANLLSLNTYTLAFFFYLDDSSSGTIMHMTVPCNGSSICSMKLASINDKLHLTVTKPQRICGTGKLREHIKANTWNVIAIGKNESLMTLNLNRQNVTFNISSCEWNVKNNITTSIRLGGDAVDIFDRIRGRVQCLALYDRLIETSDFVKECEVIHQDTKPDYWSCSIFNHLPNRVLKFRRTAVNHRPLANIAPLSTLNVSHGIICARACVALNECVAFVIANSDENCRMYDFVETRSLTPSVGDQYYVLRHL